MSTTKDSFIQIIEVAPRDGLQNEKNILSTEEKVQFINLLLAAGLKEIEVTSFVSPKLVPQLADAEDLLSRLPEQNFSGFSALVPNAQGLTRALHTKLDRYAFFAAASETFSQKNINLSISKSLENYSQLAQQALAANKQLRGYVSCAFGCAYEGEVSIAAVCKVVQAFYDCGCQEICLADTIGIATKKKIREVLAAVLEIVPKESLALHLHNTYGQALVNVETAINLGIRRFDSAAAGIGGCPFSPNSAGNLATEELLYFLAGAGLNSGVNLEALLLAASYVTEKLQRKPNSNLALAKIENK